MMQEDGEQIGRFKVRGLMWELGLISEQSGSHAYKKATVERPDIPNTLNRELNVPEPSEVWCGDITYIWAQGKWHYLVVVMDLYAHRIGGWALSGKPDTDLVTKAPFSSKLEQGHTGGYTAGRYRGRQGRIARNKKARTGRASWVFRRLSETGLDSYLVGRGNLNLDHNFLILNDICGFSFVVEYHLEYRFPKRYFAWDSNLRPSRMLGLSAGRSLN